MIDKNIFKKYSTLTNSNNFQKENTANEYDKRYFEHFYLKHFPTNKNIRILDIGCGNGKYLNILNNKGYANAWGIDISQEQIELAKKNLSNVECIDSLTFLKKNKVKYDVILLIDVLEYIDLPETFEILQLAYLSLNDHGKLFIQVPNAISAFSPLRYADITHQRAYTIYSLTQTINLSDFKKYCFFELYPYIHGFKSFIRNILWNLIIKPLISAFQYIAYGTNFNKIYTANFLCVLEK
ncbi:MAG: class I SAM-dependent methyltransferase [Parachlamydiales bacterium]|jgi:2-polyprenyl-3-methyl-5-hydroxy-6-metoxy-1,4-benzoquinol methylase